MKYGEPSPKPEPPEPKQSGLRLSPRDLRILKFVAAFWLAISDVLARVFFHGLKKDAMKSTLRRLCGKGPTYRLLRPEPLDTHRVAYRLTNRGARLIGASPQHARPLGPQARIERLAVLQFIHAEGEAKRTLISGKKLREHFDLTGHRLPRHRFYLEEEGESLRLGFLVVDHGAHTKRIVRKSVQVLARFLRHGWFDDYLKNSQFTLTILTVTPGKQRAIRIGLKQQLNEVLGRALGALHPPAKDGFPLPVQIVVVPGILSLLPGRKYQDERSEP